MTTDASRASSTDVPGGLPRPALEIAVTSAAGAVTARDGGADRVELCSALELGGVTPSQGLVEAAVATGVPVHALVRCRPGGFVYDADELDVMVREIRALVRSGVAGVVVGALREDGSLDVDALRWFVDAALDAAATPRQLPQTPARARGSERLQGVSGLEITVHRAVDRAADPVAAVAALAGRGVTRVLTSGGASTVAAGLASGVLPRVVDASGDVQVMAGGGVRLRDVSALVAAGVDAVHLSAKRVRAARTGTDAGAERRPGPGTGTGTGTGTVVSLGAEAATDSWFETDAALVHAMRRALDDTGAGVRRPASASPTRAS